MKTSVKAIAAALALSLSLMPLAACGQRADTAEDAAPAAEATETSTAAVDIASLKTLGDILSIDAQTQSSTWDEDHYIVAFVQDGVPIRAIADITPELYDQIESLDFLDPNHDQQLIDIVGNAPLVNVEDFSSAIASQEELDALVGKTGQELLDAGYEFGGFFTVGEFGTQAYMDNRLLRYTVEFNESLPVDSDMDDENLVKDLTVKSIQFSEFSNAALDPTEIG